MRVGGTYRIEIVPDDLPPGPEGEACAERRTAAVGNYTQVVPNDLLQFTWAADWNPGEQSLVTVSLKDVPGGTEITILRENFNQEASRDGHNQGWIGCLDQLAGMLEA